MSQDTARWERQKTIKLYVHPPRSERMVTLWPDFKIVNSARGKAVTQGTEAIGFLLLTGTEYASIPWQETAFNMRENGTPIHAMEYADSELTFAMESFCSMDRCPAVYTRFIIRNDQLHKAAGQISLVPRSGPETLMMGINRDGYCSYRPTAGAWGMIPSAWSMSGQTVSNETHSLVLQSRRPVKMQWVAAEPGDALHLRHRCDIEFELEAGQALEIDVCLDRGAGKSFEYVAERARTEAAWELEHSQITNTPDFAEPHYAPMFNHLVTQMLQVIVSHEGEDYVAVAQGGIERGIWPTEAVELLLGLDKVGLHHYSGQVYSYFRDTQIKEGDGKGRVPSLMALDWANNTGATLWGLSQHLMLSNDAQRFAEYREMLLNGWEWIERTRQQTLDGKFDGIGKGLFPPMSATDWGDEAQSWCWTDAWNIMGQEKLVQVLEQFDDPAASAVRASSQDYRSIMERILEEVVQKNELADEIFIVNQLGIEPIDPPLGPYFADGPTNLIRAGIIKADSITFELVENFFRNRKMMRNGLCGLMTDGLLLKNHAADPWAGHTWYTTLPEISWFDAWLERGEFDKAEETFKALTRYGMTAEFYLAERYADNDPTFAPWQPNGSGSGRMIAMMFDYCALKSGGYESQNTAKAGADVLEAVA